MQNAMFQLSGWGNKSLCCEGKTTSFVRVYEERYYSQQRVATTKESTEEESTGVLACLRRYFASRSIGVLLTRRGGEGNDTEAYLRECLSLERNSTAIRMDDPEVGVGLVH